MVNVATRYNLQCVEPAELGQDVRLVVFLEHVVDRREIVNRGMLEMRWGEPLTVVRAIHLVYRRTRFDSELGRQCDQMCTCKEVDGRLFVRVQHRIVVEPSDVF